MSDSTRAREALGLTRGEFARLLGCSRQNVQQLESRGKKPSALSRAFFAICQENPRVVLSVLRAHPYTKPTNQENK